MAGLVHNFYGIGLDFSLNQVEIETVSHEEGIKVIFDAGFIYAVSEYGTISKNGSWTNYTNFNYGIYKKDYPYGKTNLTIGDWHGFVKSVHWSTAAVTFCIYDKHYTYRDFESGREINGIIFGIQKLKELSSFQNWAHSDLFLEAKSLKSKLENQDKMIQSLQLEIENLKAKIPSYLFSKKHY